MQYKLQSPKVNGLATLIHRAKVVSDDLNLPAELNRPWTVFKLNGYTKWEIE